MAESGRAPGGAVTRRRFLAAAAAEQLALLREWKERGVFRYFGVTHFQESANERLIALMEREKLDFVQVNYSMAERSVERRLLPAAAATGTAVLDNLSAARGRLPDAAMRGKMTEFLHSLR